MPLLYLLKLRSDGSRLSEPLDIMAAIEKSVPFFEAAAATAAAAAVALQWFDAPSSMIYSIVIHFVQVSKAQANSNHDLFEILNWP